MKERQSKNFLPVVNARKPLAIISIILVLTVLAGLYLSIAWYRYKRMGELQAIQLAQSVGSLLHVEHIAQLYQQADSPESLLVEQSLVQLVEVTDPIYYAYILQRNNGSISITVDSSDADSDTSLPANRSCSETIEINSKPFDTGESVVTGPLPTPCGNWIRVLVPIFDSNEKVVAVLGLSYSASEWHTNLLKKMIPDVLMVILLIALVITLFNLLRENLKYKQAEQSRQESERSKSVFFSHIPGMAYRCKDDQKWTMEFVSEGCFDLTGYRVEDFFSDDLDNRVTFKDIISPEYSETLRNEWNRVLPQRKWFRAEYEIVTKTGERKWVLELGQGIYDDDGNVEALEGVILDYTDRKKKERQIEYLREHDFLTGLYNRNYMEQEKRRLDQPEYLPLSVAICDIDGLRVINDAYGTQEGDYLILKTAQLLRNCLEGEYVIGHTGSGEFLILLPNTDSQAADLLTAKIKSSIESYNRCNTDSLYDISVSIGHSTKEVETQELQNVTAEADENMRRRKMLNQNSSHSAIVSSIMATLYAKSQETEEHGQRLGRLSTMIGRAMGLSQTELDDLQLLSKLHDIGKVIVDNQILNKPEKLSREEWKIMRQHSEIGYRIAVSMPQLKHIAEYILYHHERWDGTGYPEGLKGERIPIASRILSVADAFDAMTNDRVYRRAIPIEDAIKEIKHNAGTQFDPNIAELFVRLAAENPEMLFNDNPEDNES
ncbi:MAG: HD domain-containing phosphohydrolase [Eubacteriales bacterium]|jgi:diguanylate cyclase (GGDEF)-like protein/PAS domain S-box-containing protein